MASEEKIGHKNLSDEQIELIQEIRKIGVSFELLNEKLKNRDDIDKRWLSIGLTDAQKSLMSLVRSIAKPDFF